MIRPRFGYALASTLFLLHALPSAAAQQTVLAAPTVECLNTTQHTIFLRVTAGSSGAAAGFSLQWVRHADFPWLTCGASNEGALWPSSDDPRVCKASFSGVPGCSVYNLGPFASVVVEVGNLNDSECGVGLSHCGEDELTCGTAYVFRAFAHNVPGRRGANRSPFTANLCCSTENCISSCVRTQGFWKTHACDWPAPFVPGANGTATLGQCALTGNPNQQCAADMLNAIVLGSGLYTQADLLCSLAQPGQGNAVRILAHQLIAAKLNILAGASGAGAISDPINPGNPYNGMTVNDLILVADGLINTLNILTASVPTGGPGNLLGPAMTAAARLLDLYNNGDGEVAHCD